MGFEQLLAGLDQRLSILERRSGLAGEPGHRIIEMDLELPKADIGGLRFNKTRVHAVFEKQDDGWFHSRDILFMSARSTVDECSRDLLAEYLNSDDFRNSIWKQTQDALIEKDVTPDDFAVGLPRKSGGIKRYNGAVCGYWLGTPFSDNKNAFHAANSDGARTYSYASSVCGVAPMFYVRGLA
jgi:hypothetical protein